MGSVAEDKAAGSTPRRGGAGWAGVGARNHELKNVRMQAVVVLGLRCKGERAANHGRHACDHAGFAVVHGWLSYLGQLSFVLLDESVGHGGCGEKRLKRFHGLEQGEPAEVFARCDDHLARSDRLEVRGHVADL